MDGHRDILGMYIGENESAKFWLSVLNGLKNRGVEDILIVCVDGLSGFPQAIEAVYPQAEIQHCIIHQIRNTTKFVSYKDIKELMGDLKRVYTAVTEEVALNELEVFNDKWGKNTLRFTVPGVIIGRPYPHISNIRMRSENSFIQLMQSRDSTVSYAKSPKAGLYSLPITAF